MGRKKQADAFQEAIAEAVAVPNEKTRRAIISRAAKHQFVAANAKRPTGRPTPYTERLGIEICERIARGEVLPEIVKDLHISINTVYLWIEKDFNGFRERYKTARLQQAETLVDNLLLETRHIEKDEALAKKVRASIVQWYSSKVNPQFGDTRRVELQGQLQLQHQHIHELAPEQRQRIAESWLVSRNSAPALESTTTEPEGSVIVVDSEHSETGRIIPTRMVPEPKKRKVEDLDW